MTEDECEALAVASLAARALLAPTPLSLPLERATSKLRAAWVADVLLFEPEHDEAHWSFDGAMGGEAAPTAAEVFRMLVRAARERRAVNVDYYTASRQTLTSGRRLVPLGLVVRSGSWLVAAVDADGPPDRGGLRPVKDFALAGFRHVDDAGPATPGDGVPADFSLSLHVRDRFGALTASASAPLVVTVRLLVEPEAVPYFERKLYHPTQQIDDIRPDGRAVVSYEAGGLDAAAAFALSWGPKVCVLEPARLVDQVAEALRAAVARYDRLA
jgi:predicted DNA-binding transcriptional regulator YafY